MARRHCKFFTAAALAKGAKVEKREHRLSMKMATKIARDHLCENPSYYAPKGKGKKSGRFGSAKPFVAVAVDHRGIVHGSWPAASVAAAMAAADAGAGKAYSVTVRADRTSDGTVQGPGRGRVEAVREHGRWIRY